MAAQVPANTAPPSANGAPDGGAPPPQKTGGKGGKGGGKGGKGGGGGKKGKKKPQALKIKDLFDEKDESMEYVHHRLRMFDEIWEASRKAAVDAEEKVTVTLPDGSEKSAVKGVTTPLDIAAEISKGLAKQVIVAKVDGEVFDAFRPFEKDCKLELLKFSDPIGQDTFWHSSAHVLGQCMERLYSGKLTIGPALKDRFYYDIDMGDRKVSQEDYDHINACAKKIASAKQPFQRIVMTKDQALEMFKYNKFKQQIVQEKIVDGTVCTAYRCGPLIDLCRGPHIPNTGLIKGFGVINHGSCYWKGDAENPQLQRVYGVAYPDTKQLKQRLLEEELKRSRDHRKIGQEQKLFFFNEASAGSAFWLPHGARIYNKLLDFIKGEYRKRGYDEVMSPNIYNMKLFEQSKHAVKYRKDMFVFGVEDHEYALKPMNCPGHCVMFNQLQRSYKDLPIRYADFGVLHRNELSGALSGLTRVRRFQQDDAHVFVREDQIAQEVRACLDFMKDVYAIFGFRFELALSKRHKDNPEKQVGTKEQWDTAENGLREALTAFTQDNNMEFIEEDGEAAFYGPKIDIKLLDAMGREFQCATVQLDFQLPDKPQFDLHYHAADGSKKRPVIIHRALYGSLERFIAILCEHTGGKWPFFLSPRQAIVVPVSAKFSDYARQVGKKIHDAGYYVEVDESDNHVKKKIREAQLDQHNFILVVGQEEADCNGVKVRKRNGDVEDAARSVDSLLEMFAELTESKDATM